MRLRFTLFFPLVIAVQGIWSTNLANIFGPYVSNGTEFAASSDSDFFQVASGRWSTWQAPKFQAAIKPVTEADVQAIVRIATQNRIHFLATVNGHGTSLGFGKFKDGLNINLGNLNSVSIDVENNRLTVGGGSTFGDVHPLLFAAGKEIQSGNTICVSVLGATIGGGIGVQQGNHGLVLDALMSVRMVTAKGDVVTASREENPELFWGIRGAGANFGIITSATYEIYDQTNGGNVVLGNLEFPAATNRTIWEILRSYDDELPGKLSLQHSITFNHTTGRASIVLGFIYLGTMAEAKPHLDRYLALNPVATTIFNQTTTTNMYNIFSGACTPGAYHNEYMVGLGKTYIPAFESIFSQISTFCDTHPTFTGQVVAQRYSNDVMMTKPSGDTSYPWRDIKIYILINNIYDGPSLDDEVDAFSKKIRATFQSADGFPSPQIYSNYDHGDEGPTALWGVNLRRLRTLKDHWDPENLFGIGNPIR